MSVTEPKGSPKIEIQDTDGNKIEVKLEVRYQLISVLPPIGKQKKYLGLRLTIIYAEEKDTLSTETKLYRN